MTQTFKLLTGRGCFERFVISWVSNRLGPDLEEDAQLSSQTCEMLTYREDQGYQENKNSETCPKYSFFLDGENHVFSLSRYQLSSNEKTNTWHKGSGGNIFYIPFNQNVAMEEILKELRWSYQNIPTTSTSENLVVKEMDLSECPPPGSWHHCAIRKIKDGTGALKGLHKIHVSLSSIIVSSWPSPLLFQFDDYNFIQSCFKAIFLMVSLNVF